MGDSAPKSWGENVYREGQGVPNLVVFNPVEVLHLRGRLVGRAEPTGRLAPACMAPAA